MAVSKGSSMVVLSVEKKALHLDSMMADMMVYRKGKKRVDMLD
jgi:hypothetical protein